jgi:preprotein translocase subunit SecD
MAAAEQAAELLRARLAAVGIDDARVSVSSAAGVTITAPGTPRSELTALTQRGRLAIYDWERSVLGNVPGGAGAGQAGGLTRAEAERRAERAPGARVAQAPGGGRWFALAGEPAVTNAEVRRATAGVDVPTGEPIVELDFTAAGERAFAALTAEIARRGAARTSAGKNDLDALQHFAIVVDDRLLSLPFIDPRVAPDGLDGAAGAQISGDLTPQAARRLAAILHSGPLPADLTLRDG